MTELVQAPVTGADGRALSERGVATRRRLLQAAEKVFSERGYQAASIVKITEAAGVAQGTFYLYFLGKREIFEELVMDLNSRVRHTISEEARLGKSRAETEELGFRAYFRFTAEHPALYRVLRQAEFASPDVLRRHYERFLGGYTAGLREAMDRGEIEEADPEVLAWVLMGIAELTGMRWVLWGDGGEVPDQTMAELDRILRRLLGAAPEPEA